MTPKERIYAIIEGKSYDRCAVTPIFMAWAAHFAGHTYRDYYLDGDVLVGVRQTLMECNLIIPPKEWENQKTSL